MDFWNDVAPYRLQEAFVEVINEMPEKDRLDMAYDLFYGDLNGGMVELYLEEVLEYLENVRRKEYGD